MAYELKAAHEGGVLLPDEVIRNIDRASETDLKVILCLYSAGKKRFEREEMVDLLSGHGIGMSDAESALSFWRGAGVLETARTGAPKSADARAPVKAPRQERVTYPSEQLAAAVDGVPGMKQLIETCQRRFGKMLNSSHISTIYSFYADMDFSVDVIMLVAQYCTDIGKPSVGYMQRILNTLLENEICDYEKVEKYLNDRKFYTASEGRLRSLCGFGSRELTPSEKKIASVWFSEWNIDFSLVEKAYEITVDRIGKPSLKYMNTILTDWHDNGVPDASGGKKTGTASHDADDFFKSAVSRSMSPSDK